MRYVVGPGDVISIYREDGSSRTAGTEQILLALEKADWLDVELHAGKAMGCPPWLTKQEDPAATAKEQPGGHRGASEVRGGTVAASQEGSEGNG